MIPRLRPYIVPIRRASHVKVLPPPPPPYDWADEQDDPEMYVGTDGKRRRLRYKCRGAGDCTTHDHDQWGEIVD